MIGEHKLNDDWHDTIFKVDIPQDALLLVRDDVFHAGMAHPSMHIRAHWYFHHGTQQSAHNEQGEPMWFGSAAALRSEAHIPHQLIVPAST